MDEHDDDLEPEVVEDAGIETERFDETDDVEDVPPISPDDEQDESEDEPADTI
jgi:hypothetical protein